MKSSKYQQLKRNAYEIIECSQPDSKVRHWSKLVDWILIIFVLISISAVILETIPEIQANQIIMYWLHILDIVTVTFFTIEYIIRLWSVTSNPNYSHAIFGRLRFMFGFLPLVDLLAIMPFYIGLFETAFVVDLRFLRILRITRFLRVIKLARYSKAIQSLFAVLNKKKADLIIALSIVLLTVLLSASIMYFVEHEAQPNGFSSIPDAMWWAICTLTTVGYGDVYPITWLGKFLSAIITVASIGMIALPAGIIVSGYQEVSANLHKEKCDDEMVDRFAKLEEKLEKIENMIKNNLNQNKENTDISN